MMKSDYDTDFYEWTQHQAAALAAGHVSELDLANLAEEIESLGKRDRRGLRNNLKWRHQPEMRQMGRSWESSIIEHRDRIELIADDSPSLRRQIPALLTEAYTRARRLAGSETGLPLETFPDTCPWTVEQILDETFWPNA
jgi:hypothetical protein